MQNAILKEAHLYSFIIAYGDWSDDTDRMRFFWVPMGVALACAIITFPIAAQVFEEEQTGGSHTIHTTVDTGTDELFASPPEGTHLIEYDFSRNLKAPSALDALTLTVGVENVRVVAEDRPTILFSYRGRALRTDDDRAPSPRPQLAIGQLSFTSPLENAKIHSADLILTVHLPAHCARVNIARITTTFGGVTVAKGVHYTTQEIIVGHGHITLSLPPTTRYLKVRTGSGSIQLGIARDEPFRILAETYAGRVIAPEDTTIRPTVAGERATLRRGAGGSPIELLTGAGTITISDR